MIYDQHGRRLTVSDETAKALADQSIPFSLECKECDAGMDIKNYQHALSEGWRDIEYDDGMGWNYLGHCPCCIGSELLR